MSADILEVRLRFHKIVPETPEQVVESTKVLLADNQDKIVGRITHHHIRIRILEPNRHFWSPELSLHLLETGLGTEVRGLYGPKPNIWLGYMFTYFFLGFVTLVVSVIGFSRYNLGLSSYILWFVPFILSGVLVLWITSRVGQRLGKKEVNLIHGLMESAIFQNAENEPN